jgi:hypothetical protein
MLLVNVLVVHEIVQLVLHDSAVPADSKSVVTDTLLV